MLSKRDSSESEIRSRDLLPKRVHRKARADREKAADGRTSSHSGEIRCFGVVRKANASEVVFLKHRAAIAPLE